MRTGTVALFTAVLIVAGGCADQQGAGPAPAELVHIHRLQEAPGGALYAATHTGLYTVDGGRAEPVGDASHDLMGFTVAGPGDLLASGHPDLRAEALLVEGKPPLLGLVASRDGAEWKPLSLLGEVDFHSLVSAHGLVYGVDSGSGSLMVSSDRRTWQTRAEGLPYTDIAVSPADRDLLVGASPDGAAVSRDGGRSWSPAAREPLLYLSWTESGLFGVSPVGTVARSDDEGASWETMGTTTGSPAALLVTKDGRVVVANGRGIFESAGDGKPFAPLLEVAPSH